MSGKQPSAPTTTTTVNQLYSPEESARRAALMGRAEQIYNQTSGVASAQGAPRPSSDTLQAQEMMRRLARTSSLPQIGQQAMQAQTVGFEAMQDPTNAPGFQATLDTALRRINEQFTGPSGPFAGIRSAYTGANSGGSGSREGIAMGLAGRDYLNTVGDVTGRLTSDAYGRATDLFSRTLALAPQTAQLVQGAEMNEANVIGAIGQQREAYDQAQRDWELQAPWAAMGPYASVVTGMSNPSTQTTSTAPAPRANPMAPFGMAMMGASLGSMTGIGAPIGAGAGLLLGLLS